MTFIPRGDFGKWLDKELKKQNLSPNQLASILGMGRDTVVDNLEGRRLPYDGTILLYAEFFNVDPSYLRSLVGVRLKPRRKK